MAHVGGQGSLAHNLFTPCPVSDDQLRAPSPGCCPRHSPTISEEGVGEVEAAHHAREGVVGRAGLDAALHRRHLHVVRAGLLRQLCIGLLQLQAGRALSSPPHALPTRDPPRAWLPGGGWSQLTLLLALAARFLPETRLLRMRRKDWRSDFFSDFTRDRGPSMARESLGCRVHLGQAGPVTQMLAPASPGARERGAPLAQQPVVLAHPSWSRQVISHRASISHLTHSNFPCGHRPSPHLPRAPAAHPPTWPTQDSCAGSQRDRSRGWCQRPRASTPCAV